LILTELRGGAVASRPEDVPSLLLAGILPHLKIVTMTVIEEIAPRALTHAKSTEIGRRLVVAVLVMVETIASTTRLVPMI
jgi:hypothetical protein